MELSGSNIRGAEGALGPIEDVSVDLTGGEAQALADFLELMLSGSSAERLDDGENVLMIERL